MILIDTNVVSELMRVVPAVQVVAWLDGQPATDFYLSAVSLAEMLAGVAILPDGRRKSDLADALQGRLLELFEGRVLPFGTAAATAYASIVADARRAGIAIGMADGQIAATALVHDFAVATREVAPFRGVGLRVIDPWSEARSG